MTDTRTTDRRVSDERLNELIEWYVDDCNAYTEQHDADIRSLLGELAARRLADETPALPTAAETACWHGPGFVCPLCHPVLSVMPDSAADTSSAGQGASDEATVTL
jgi:hypothetical protein